MKRRLRQSPRHILGRSSQRGSSEGRRERRRLMMVVCGDRWVSWPCRGPLEGRPWPSKLYVAFCRSMNRLTRPGRPLARCPSCRLRPSQNHSTRLRKRPGARGVASRASEAVRARVEEMFRRCRGRWISMSRRFADDAGLPVGRNKEKDGVRAFAESPEGIERGLTPRRRLGD